ncbi:hypothetical protein [Solimonas soli]|uniref:hypothetical protein n=1 Tax=Solimonas soli TaxID=413479 RepID=UPI0004889F9D|nr:hypothetical protein [Solimonas soli]
MTNPLSHVSPGDIISAADWNLLIDSLNDALVRLDALETGGGGTALAVDQLLPPGPYRIGDTLQIVGRNFQFAAGAARVFFNAQQAFTLTSNSTDSKLELVIPTVAGVLESGTNVDLVVMNQAQQVTRQIVLRPRLNPLQGNITIGWQSVTPQTVLAGQPVTFLYRVTSGTNNAATWALTAQVNVASNAAAWNSQLQICDAQGNVLNPAQINLQPGQQMDVQVRIPSVPAGSNGTSFGVTLNAGSANISGSSGINQFVVGTPTPPPDATITMDTVPAYSMGALSGNTLTVPGGQSRLLVLNTTLTVPGTYNVTRAVLGGATGWTINLDSGTTDSFVITAADVSGGSTARLLRYSVAATAGASTPAQIEIRLQRQGNSSYYAKALNTVRS